jgi:histidinol-phosphatase (PHP family)
MINWTNYHCHSEFSDGKGHPEDFIKKAIELKMPSLGFSEHAPLPFYTSWNMPAANLENYLSTLKNLKEKYAHAIEIYLGLEIDYIAKHYEKILEMAQVNQLDYTIGSIHFLGFKENGEAWNTDGTAGEFEVGAWEIFHNHGENLVRAYYTAIIEMIDRYHPTIIGHIDKIKMHNAGDKYFVENSKYYRGCAIAALEVAKKSNCIVELNTRGLYRHPEKLSYPSLWMLKQMKDLSIRTTLNSDSHKTDEIIHEFTAASELLKTAGYNSIWRMQKGGWYEFELS